jgi:hypothetical protein
MRIFSLQNGAAPRGPLRRLEAEANGGIGGMVTSRGGAMDGVGLEMPIIIIFQDNHRPTNGENPLAGDNRCCSRPASLISRNSLNEE